VTERNTNGRIHWVVEGTNKTYGEWQDEQVSAAAAQVNEGSSVVANAIAREDEEAGHDQTA
jgi:hypothetical protein